jgi:hypothetical protein
MHYAHPVVVCANCNRQQKSLTTADMEYIGWRIFNSQWICPFCTGNTQNLRRIFGQGEGEDECDTGFQP